MSRLTQGLLLAFNLLFLVLIWHVAGAQFVTGSNPPAVLYTVNFNGGLNDTIINDQTGSTALCLVLSATTQSNQYALTPRICANTTSYTVGTLPAGVFGNMASVNDAVACVNGGTLTGSGSATCLVWFNGSVWHAVAP